MPFLGGADVAAKCLLDDNAADWMSYGELRACAHEWRDRLAGGKALVFLYAGNDVPSVAALIGALSAGHAVALLDPQLPQPKKAALEARYSPEFVIDSATDARIARSQRHSIAPHPDLALLLSTSGSTGSPKLVRLTMDNIVSNAHAIAQVLAITSQGVAAAHLPLHYSFGLSVLTSHLVCGASICLTNSGLMDRTFWARMKHARVTQLPGVPFHFEMLEKLGYRRLDVPSLAALIQAGGHLAIDARMAAHRFMSERGGRFFVMYGQTEASPRMTTLQHEDFRDAPASVGPAIPGGSLEIVDADQNGRGEVLYRGPNVMMGYAEQREDLARGDELGGLLHTGDIGFLDDIGRLTLTGRASRSGKVFGLRVNLDEVEKITSSVRPSAVIQCGEGLCVFHEQADETARAAMAEAIKSSSTLPPAALRFVAVERIPRTARGKIDYRALESLA